MLRLCRGLDPQDLLADQAEQAREEARLNQRRQAIEGELVQLNQQIGEYLESIGRATGAFKLVLEGKLKERYAQQAELEDELSSMAGHRTNTAEAVAQHLQSVEDLITKMGELRGEGRGEGRGDLRRRLRHSLHQLIDRIDLGPGRHQTKINVAFKDSGILSLVLDGKGSLRFADDGTRLYYIDEDGTVDVDQRSSYQILSLQLAA